MSAQRNVKVPIVEAAVRLFSNQGFSGTSTREIARLAAVDETSIFRHFPRKLDLFWAAVGSRLERFRLRQELENGLAENGDPRMVIPMIVELLVETIRQQPEIVRLLNVSMMELRPSAEELYRRNLAPFLLAFIEYLKRCVEKGTLRSMDPGIAAVALVATVVGHPAVHHLITGEEDSFPDTQAAVSAYSEFWLGALLPAESQGELPV